MSVSFCLPHPVVVSAFIICSGHCLCLQETHRSKDQARPKIPGMALVAERPHKHGSSVFIRDGLQVNNNNNNCLKSNIQKVQWTIINDIHI